MKSASSSCSKNSLSFIIGVMSRNVFDNPSFFSKYMELRKDYNHNDLLEHPGMCSLLPALKGKSVIDLGCGYGSYAHEFLDRGASSYLGIDSSENMIRRAMEDNGGEGIEYLRLNLDDLSSLSGSFDLAYSSLVFHYIEDFDRLLKNINGLLNPGGILLFSQMHPFVTASPSYNGYFEGDYFAFTSYPEEGRREGRWFKEKVVSYHRRLSSIINSISNNGFFIERILEPVPSDDAIRELPSLEKDLVRPTFLIVRARKDYS